MQKTWVHGRRRAEAELSTILSIKQLQIYSLFANWGGRGEAICVLATNFPNSSNPVESTINLFYLLV